MFELLTDTWHFYDSHLESLKLPFQPVLKNWDKLQAVRHRCHRFHYLFAFVFTLLVLLDTSFLYISCGYDETKPFFYHVILLSYLPEVYMEQGEVAFNCLLLLAILTYGTQVLDNHSHAPYILYYTYCNESSAYRLGYPHREDEFKMLEKGVERRLIKAYTFYSRKIGIFCSLYTYQVHVGFSIPFLCAELYRVYSIGYTTFRTVISVIITPFLMRYVINSYFVGVYFMFLNRMIQVKQRCYYLEMSIDRMHLKFSKQFQKAYLKCRMRMIKILDLTREIEAFNVFYSKYVTLTILLHGISSVSVFTAVSQKADKTMILFTIIWIVYSVWYAFYVALICAFSSRTRYLNVCMFKKLKQLQVKLLSGRRLHILQVVKLDLANEYKELLQKCCFRLWNNAMVNNRLYVFHIFSFVSFVYMKLFSKKLF